MKAVGSVVLAIVLVLTAEPADGVGAVPKAPSSFAADARIEPCANAAYRFAVETPEVWMS